MNYIKHINYIKHTYIIHRLKDATCSHMLANHSMTEVASFSVY